MAVQSPPEAPVTNQKGFEVIPAGSNTPTFSVDRHGSAYFAGAVRIDGQLQMTGGGTSGTVMGNNEFLSGTTTSDVVKRLIGINTSNVVSIDTDALGAAFGGTVAVAGTLTVGADAVLERVAQDTLALKDGASNMVFRIYTGLLYLEMQHNGINAAQITTSGDHSLILGSLAGQWAIGPTGLGNALLPLTTNVYDLGTTSSRVRTGYFGTSLISPLGTFTTAISVGTTTALAVTGAIRSAHNNQWIGRDTGNSNDRNVIAWGVTTTDTVIVGDVNVALAFNASGIRINGTAGASGTFGSVTVVNGIVTAGT